MEGRLLDEIRPLRDRSGDSGIETARKRSEIQGFHRQEPHLGLAIYSDETIVRYEILN